jgi:hypothetical protein
MLTLSKKKCHQKEDDLVILVLKTTRKMIPSRSRTLGRSLQNEDIIVSLALQTIDDDIKRKTTAKGRQ